jgi:pimeloyl-ACP methyl ester carboxylesterase
MLLLVKEFAVPAGRAALAAEVDGEGTLLVCLHAGVCDRRMWRPLAAALKNSFRMVAYDRRGFGETPATDERRSQVDDLLAVMDHPAVEPKGQGAILVGCSQGGRIAIDAALQSAERFRALVLIAPAVSGAPPPGDLPPPVKALMSALEGAEKAGDVDRINALAAHAWLDGPLAPEGRVGGDLRKLFLRMNAIALNAPPLPSLQQPPPAYERIPEIAVPTLLLWGDLDFPHLQARCHHLAQWLPRATSHVIKDTAHLPSLEQPERCAALIRAFVDDVAQPRGGAG